MKLNCKPGDLAVIVKNAKINLGKIVTCLRLATEEEKKAVSFVGACWIIDREIKTRRGYFCAMANDLQLRPLRDNPGQDEILKIVGLPEKEPA